MLELYQEFDNLITEERDIRENTSNHLEEIKRDLKVISVKYSGPVDGLGILCPSLVQDKIVSGYRKGRILNRRPEGNYTVYEFNDNKKPVRIQKFNKLGCDLSFYFIEQNNAIYAVPFFHDTNKFYITATHKLEYQSGNIFRYTKIESHVLHQEVYTYSTENSNIITCEKYYYVPNLSRSAKNIPFGEERSPGKKWKLKIFMNKNIVKRIECFEYVHGQDILDYVYQK